MKTTSLIAAVTAMFLTQILPAPADAQQRNGHRGGKPAIVQQYHQPQAAPSRRAQPQQHFRRGQDRAQYRTMQRQPHYRGGQQRLQYRNMQRQPQYRGARVGHSGRNGRVWQHSPRYRLGPPPRGQHYRVIDNRVVRVDNNTLQIVAIAGLLSALLR